MDLSKQQLSDIHDALDAAITDAGQYLDSGLAAGDYANCPSDLVGYHAKLARWQELLALVPGE